MDSVTQAVLGASIGQLLLGKKMGAKGAILGAIIATIPDLDIVLLPFYNATERISIHRGYSHSILFSILAGLIIAFLIGKFKWSKSISFGRLFLFTWLTLFTHMLLDAFTTYGTQLFLPFSNYRVSFDSVTIVDPIYTVPLIIGLSITLYYHKKYNKWSKANVVGLLFSSFYLLFTLVHKEFINSSIKAELHSQHINYKALKSIPAGMANLQWYGIAKTKDSLYLGKYTSKEKMKFYAFPINNELLSNMDSNLSQQLTWFAQDFYTVAMDSGIIRFYNLQVDMQGVRNYKDELMPTAFYFEITPQSNGSNKLSTAMHRKQ